MSRTLLAGSALLLCLNISLPATAYLSLVRQGAESDDVPNTDDHFGATVCVGDFNGDGLDDLATAAPDESNGLVNTAVHGIVMINNGTVRGIGHPASQTISVGDLGTEAVRFGRSLAAADFNQDGFDDLAVGIPQLDTAGGPDRGAVWVYRGSAGGLEGAPYRMIVYENIEIAPQDYANFGWALAAGDFNDDSYPDLVTSAIGQDSDTGVLYFFFGSQPNGITTVGFQKLYPYTVGGSAALGGRFGWSLATGQFDGNGGEDLVVGAPFTDVAGQNNAGRAYFYYAGAGGITGTGGWFLDASNMGGSATEGDAQLGFSVAAGHLYQVSGQEDVVIGAPQDNYGLTDNAGSVIFVQFDSQPNTYDSLARIHQHGFWNATSAGTGDQFGYAVAVGRYDVGNYEDVAIGAPGENVTEQAILGQQNNAGTFHIIRGSATGPDILDGETYNSMDLNNFADGGDQLGYALAFGRFDATSREGLAVGAPGADYDSYDGGTNVNDAGQVHVFAPWRQPMGYPHRSSVAFDCDGYIVYAQRPFQRVRPASTTKTVTLALACDAIFDGLVNPAQFYQVPAWVATGPGGSETPLVTGEKLSFVGLMQTMMTVSGNDSAMFIGAILSGEGGPDWLGWSSQSPSFAADMEAKVAGYGLSGSTSLTNAAGIDSGDHYVTALDWALLGRAAILDDCVETIVDEPFWIVERILPAGASLNFFQAPGDPPGELHVFEKFEMSWVNGVKGGYTPAVGIKPGGTPGGWRTGVSAGNPFNSGYNSAASFGSRPDDTPVEGVVGQSSAPLNAALLAVAETFCDDGIPDDIQMPPTDPPPPQPWNTLSGIPPCPDSGAHGINFNFGEQHAVTPGGLVQVDLMRHTFIDPGIPVRQMIMRQTEIVLGPGESVDFGSAPHQENAGLEVMNIGSTGADFEVLWGGSPVVLSLLPEDSAVIPGVNQPGPSFTGQIVSLEARDEITLRVKEIGYQFDVELGDGTALPDFHTVQISRNGKIQAESMSAWVRGFDENCGGDTMDLVARQDNDVSTGVGDFLPAAPASFQLLPPRPNPFNPRTVVRFDVAFEAPVHLAVYDLRGRLVKWLSQGETWPTGRHDLMWDGTDTDGRRVSSGVYLLRMESAGQVDTKRVTLLK